MTADDERDRFIRETVQMNASTAPHVIRRNSLYEDTINLFTNENLVNQYPFHIMFKEEQAVDCGGVARDLLTSFWEQAYTRFFDGCNLVVPKIYPDMQTNDLRILGRILSHGYIVTGFLPTQIVFPSLLCMLLGPEAANSIPNTVLLNAFTHYLCDHESEVLSKALSADEPFSQKTNEILVTILSRYGYRKLPDYVALKDQVINISRCEFIDKPLAAINIIHKGIATNQLPFWKTKTTMELLTLYLALTCNPKKVINQLQTTATCEEEEKIVAYLEQYLGNMNNDLLRRFLRFTTGSSVCISDKITVTFNRLSGLSRRPTSHTCDCTLELSTMYGSYSEFSNEFSNILLQPEKYWLMDAI